MLDRQTGELTGFPSIDKPWLKYYELGQKNDVIPETSLYGYLLENSKDHLDNYALNYFGRKITYRKLFSMIDEVAKAFISIGVQENEVVPVVSVSTVTSIVCFYALNRIGAVSDYLNVLAEEKDLQGYFEEVNAKVVVALDLFGEKVSNAAKRCGVKNVILFSLNQEMPIGVSIGYRIKTIGKIKCVTDSKLITSWHQFVKNGYDIKDINRHKDSSTMCLLAHTGGTTGDPKAVAVSDRAMNAVADGYFTIYKSSEVLRNSPANSVFLQIMIPFVIYGILTCMHMPLCMGWCLAIIPKFDGKDWSKYLKKYEFNYVFGVPAYLSAMFNDEGLVGMDFSHMRTIAMGGDGMNENLEKEINSFFCNHGFNVDVVKGYGLSEVCATAVSTFPGCNKIGSVGIPLYRNNIMVYDNDSKKELKYNEVGEICLQCPSRMIGYMNNEEATKNLFKIHDDGSEWLHTGDLGYVDEDGFLFLLGRIKRVILTTKDGVAYKVFPNIPEKVLEENEAVKQCCIVGTNDHGDQVLKAFVVLPEDALSETNHIERELRRTCKENLPSYSRPTFYEFISDLPLTAAGKVNYRKLEEMSND